MRAGLRTDSRIAGVATGLRRRLERDSESPRTANTASEAAPVAMLGKGPGSQRHRYENRSGHSFGLGSIGATPCHHQIEKGQGHSTSMGSMTILFTTKPHGEQRVFLVEDHSNPQQRIYELHDSRGNATPLVGSEMDSLVHWWDSETRRNAQA